eukprot:scaffold2119_cov67-Phaeocystis_antarctica.AAC.12
MDLPDDANHLHQRSEAVGDYANRDDHVPDVEVARSVRSFEVAKPHTRRGDEGPIEGVQPGEPVVKVGPGRSHNVHDDDQSEGPPHFHDLVAHGGDFNRPRLLSCGEIRRPREDDANAGGRQGEADHDVHDGEDLAHVRHGRKVTVTHGRQHGDAKVQGITSAVALEVHEQPTAQPEKEHHDRDSQQANPIPPLLFFTLLRGHAVVSATRNVVDRLIGLLQQARLSFGVPVVARLRVAGHGSSCDGRGPSGMAPDLCVPRSLRRLVSLRSSCLFETAEIQPLGVSDGTRE